MVIADNLYDTAALSWLCWPARGNHSPSGRGCWLGSGCPSCLLPGAVAGPLFEQEGRALGGPFEVYWKSQAGLC